VAITLAQFLWAIGQQESGGNYGSVNSGSGALGKYQIMPSNLPSWSRQVLGYSVSVSQFLSSPSIQEAIANGILGGYFRSYGAAGAAAMWYSGQPDPTKGYGNPPVSTYVNEVLGRVGGAPVNATTTTTTTTGGGAAPAVTTPVLDPTTLAAMYGLSANLINSDKGLKSLFSQAVTGQWTPDVFLAHLKNTSWWAKNSDTMRQYLTLKYTDPATFSQKWVETVMHANALAVTVGFGNLTAKGAGIGKMDPTLQAAAMHILQDGWSDARVSSWLGAAVNFHGGLLSGQAGIDFDKLHTYAYANGGNGSSAWYLNAVRAIEGGSSTIDSVIAQMRQGAAAKYAAYAPQILAGQNVLDLAAPYVQAVSTLLEIPQGSVDLTNKYISKAMQAPLPTNGLPGSQYPLWQLENDVRADPLWAKTNNARESTMTAAHQIAVDFGVAF
jgi:hypothetical protein